MEALVEAMLVAFEEPEVLLDFKDKLCNRKVHREKVSSPLLAEEWGLMASSGTCMNVAMLSLFE